MFSNLARNIKYLNELTIMQAVLCLAIVPLTIIILNEDLLTNPFYDSILTYLIMILFALLVGNKQIVTFVNIPEQSIKKTLKLTFMIVILGALFHFIGILIVGDDPQQVADLKISSEKFIKYIILLPFIGIGEEFFKLTMFIGIYSLVTSGRISKFLLSIIVVSFTFGFLHAVHSPILASIPIGLGAIPALVITFYYRSIIPAILSHVLWDGMFFLFHFQPIARDILSLFISIGIFLYLFLSKKKKVEFIK
jgi:membrane protease YdiL (CAAX protease family)